MTILSNVKSKLNEVGSIILDHMDQNSDIMSSKERIGSAIAAIVFFGAAVAAICLIACPGILDISQLASYGILAGCSVASLTSLTYPYLKKPPVDSLEIPSSKKIIQVQTLYSKLKESFFPAQVQVLAAAPEVQVQLKAASKK